MSSEFSKSESVPTRAKPDAIPRRRTILHIDYIDAVLGFTSVFLSGFGLGLLFKIAGAG